MQHAASDELAIALVPVLLHKLNNTTQYLGALDTLLADPSLAPMRARALEGLTQTAHEVDDLGWILGLIAQASGTDVLGERRESARLQALVRLVGDCLRREGRDLESPDRALQELASDADAWRVQWAVARWLFGAGRTLEKGARLRWEFAEDRRAVVCHVAAASALEELAAELRAFDPRLDADLRPDLCALILPA